MSSTEDKKPRVRKAKPRQMGILVGAIDAYAGMLLREPAPTMEEVRAIAHRQVEIAVEMQRSLMLNVNGAGATSEDE